MRFLESVWDLKILILYLDTRFGIYDKVEENLALGMVLTIGI